MKKKIKGFSGISFALAVLVCLVFAGCAYVPSDGTTGKGYEIGEQSYNSSDSGQAAASLADVPEYSGQPYVVINENQPEFDDEDINTEVFEQYSDLDGLGRCGVAYANICQELMPQEKRGSIGSVKPSGWHLVKYDNVDGKYLYNRCHLIGFQLAGENANPCNLITGTRYLNTEGMLPFENEVAAYVKETDNHVLYRVTPIFEGDNLVASGVQMEAYSVEDSGEGVCFDVYVYNVQPGIAIDYATGDSALAEDETTAADGTDTSDTVNVTGADTADVSETKEIYILNTNTHKFHLLECSSVQETKAANKQSITATRNEVIAQGYEPCGRCKP
jgi:DNA-entry nuclease